MNESGPLRVGILGARSWIANQAVIPALLASTGCELVAVACADGSVPPGVAHLDAGSYQAVLDRPDVDAVYLPLPNGLHRRWVEASAAAGKHVLCEKPLGVDVADAAAMVAACDRAGVLLAEAWMTPFGARWSEVIASAASGGLGEVRDIRAEFTFVIGPGRETNYRWDPGQGGGALLDVGIYALGAAVSLWGAEPVAVHATSRWSTTGVDTTTSVWCDWGEGRTVSALVSFELPERQRLELSGTGARLVVDGDAFTGGAAATRAALLGRDGSVIDLATAGNDPYRTMVDAFADAVRGRRAWPRPVAESVAMARLLERIAAATRPGDVDRHDGR